MQDLTQQCKDCQAPYVVTSGQQKYFKEKGLETPKRCEDCRYRRREERERAAQKEAGEQRPY